MSSLAIHYDDHAVAVSFTSTALQVLLADGRQISVPLNWFPRLDRASPEALADWRLIGGGEGIHWPLLDKKKEHAEHRRVLPLTRELCGVIKGIPVNEGDYKMYLERKYK